MVGLGNLRFSENIKIFMGWEVWNLGSFEKWFIVCK
jgi:hypothetical protein